MNQIENSKESTYVLYYAMFVLGTYIASYQAIFHRIMETYNLSASSGGALIAVHFMGALSMPILFGEIADRVGRNKVLVFSTVAFLLFGAVLFFSTLPVILFLSIFVIGGVCIVIEGTGVSLLSRNASGSVHSVIHISQMFFCLGCVVGPLTAKMILTIFSTWRYVYLLEIIFFLLLLLLLTRTSYRFHENSDRESPILSPHKPYSFRLLKNPLILLATLLMLVYVGIEVGFAFWMVSYVESLTSLETVSTVALSVYWLMMGAGRLFAVRFAKKKVSLLISGMLISLIAVTLISMDLSGNSVFVVSLFGLTGFGFSAIWPVIMTEAVCLYPKYSSTTAGILMTGSACGAALLPFLMGILVDSAGLRVAFFSVLAGIVLMILLFLQFAMMTKKQRTHLLCETPDEIRKI